MNTTSNRELTKRPSANQLLKANIASGAMLSASGGGGNSHLVSEWPRSYQAFDTRERAVIDVRDG